MLQAIAFTFSIYFSRVYIIYTFLYNDDTDDSDVLCWTADGIFQYFAITIQKVKANDIFFFPLAIYPFRSQFFLLLFVCFSFFFFSSFFTFSLFIYTTFDILCTKQEKNPFIFIFSNCAIRLIYYVHVYSLSLMMISIETEEVEKNKRNRIKITCTYVGTFF